jgi:riboflavin kinase/FMN adenylyltransferase
MDVHDGHRTLRAPIPGACVAIGNFDGVHAGHRALLAVARRHAAARGGRTVALTFDPHPTTVLAPRFAPAALTTRARRVELLGEAGADVVVVEPFTPELAAMSADDFVEHVLRGALGAEAVVVGWDFTYGSRRGGTTATLQAHGARAGFTVEIVDQVRVDGELASSTAVRAHLRAGDVAAARRLLGRDPDLDGVVVPGARRGRQLGFPTANVATDLPPPLAPGIYACRLEVDGGPPLPAVASLGTNPTFAEHGGRLVLEVHVLDFDGDLYGRRVRVRFAAHLRDEQRYDGVDALVAQIRRDVDATRAVLAAR